MKSDVMVLAVNFEKFDKKVVNDFGINPLHNISLPEYTWQCCLKITGIEMQTFQDHEMFLTEEFIIKRRISSAMGDTYVQNDENTKIVYMGMNNLYGWNESTFTIQTPSI